MSTTAATGAGWGRRDRHLGHGSLVRARTAESGLGNPDLLASLARIAVWALAIVVAVNQLGIATPLVNTLFMAIVGGIALALGLAFGLGGRETLARAPAGRPPARTDGTPVHTT